MDMPEPRRLFDAVVFDLDGTLIDSAPDIHAAINHIIAEDGFPPLSLPLITSFIGNGVATLVERAYRHLGALPSDQDLDVTVARFADVYAQNAAVLTRPYPGVVDGLEALKRSGVRLGVCTNKPSAIAWSILKALDIGDVFDAVIGGDSCARRKPDPEPLFACIDALGAAPMHAIYIGDSETDVQTAFAAGVRMVAVTYGYAQVEPADLGADATIDRIDLWVSAMGLPPASRTKLAS